MIHFFRFFEREVENSRSRDERVRALNQIKAIESERLNLYQQEQEKLQKMEEESRNMQKAIDLILKLKNPPQ